MSTTTEQNRSAYMCLYEKVGFSQSCEATAVAAAAAGVEIAGKDAVSVKVVAASESKASESSPTGTAGGSEAEFASLMRRVLVAEGGRKAKPFEVLRAVIPAATFDGVFRDNVQFLQDQWVYSVEFFNFVKQLFVGVEVRLRVLRTGCL